MHDKPNMTPLDSKSRSGKLIDRIIELTHTRCVKTNLYNVTSWPDTHDAYNDVLKWAQRVEYTSDDLIICLGACVQDVFKKGLIPFIKIGHPSAVWSKEKQVEYIELAIKRIEGQK